jgi:hypothetical protein
LTPNNVLRKSPRFAVTLCAAALLFHPGKARIRKHRAGRCDMIKKSKERSRLSKTAWVKRLLYMRFRFIRAGFYRFCELLFSGY